MRTSIATVSLSGSLEEKLVAIAEAGFDGVEIVDGDLLSSGSNAAGVGRRARDLGLTIEMYQPIRDFEGVPAQEAAAAHARGLTALDTAAALGAPLVLVCSNTRKDTDADLARMADSLRLFSEAAAERGLKVGYEALAWGAQVRTLARARSVVERVNHAHLGLVADSFHALAATPDLSALEGMPGKRIFFVQLSDAPRLDMDPMSLRRQHSNFPGEGSFDLPGFLAAVLKTGYTGPVSVEVFNTVRHVPAGEFAPIAYEALIRTGTDALRRLNAQSAGIRPPP